MDLQTKGGKSVTSENALSPNNFRAYSPQTADDRRRQQDTPASNSRSRRRSTTWSPTHQTRAIVVESVCQLNSASAQVDVFGERPAYATGGPEHSRRRPPPEPRDPVVDRGMWGMG